MLSYRRFFYLLLEKNKCLTLLYKVIPSRSVILPFSKPGKFTISTPFSMHFMTFLICDNFDLALLTCLRSQALSNLYGGIPFDEFPQYQAVTKDESVRKGMIKPSGNNCNLPLQLPYKQSFSWVVGAHYLPECHPNHYPLFH